MEAHSLSFWQIIGVTAIVLLCYAAPFIQIFLIRCALTLAIKKERAQRALATK